MMLLLEAKETIKEAYYKNKNLFDAGWKFLLALVVILFIDRQMGYNQKMGGLPVALGLALISAFLPSGVFVFLIAIFTIGQIFSASVLLSGIVAALFLIMYCFVLRFTPGFSYVLLATPVLFVLKIPYCVPLLLGLVSTPVAILPMCCGVVCYYMFFVIQTTANTTFGVSVEDTLNIYKLFVSGVFSNKDMIVTLLVFSLALIVTYVIRKQIFDHAFESGVLGGAIAIILGFLMGSLFFDTAGVFSVLLGTVISALLVEAIWFFRSGLDYTAVERIQFEDDNYYYYVKAVPKISVTAPKKNVKRMNRPRTENFDE
jgi:hypothetical protein